MESDALTTRDERIALGEVGAGVPIASGSRMDPSQPTPYFQSFSGIGVAKTTATKEAAKAANAEVKCISDSERQSGRLGLHRMLFVKAHIMQFGRGFR